MPQSSPQDECDFTDLFQAGDEYFLKKMSRRIWSCLTGSHKRQRWEKDLEAFEKILSLYTQPITAEYFIGPVIGVKATYRTPQRYRIGDHYEKARHYRTRGELGKAGKSKRLIELLIDYGMIELHRKWPRELAGHPQAPYRSVVSEWL